MSRFVIFSDRVLSYYRYVTGRSRSTNLTFSKSWVGYESFHNAFVEWLRSTYCGWTLIQGTCFFSNNLFLAEEERVRRRGFATSAVEVVSPRPNASNTPDLNASNTPNLNAGGRTSPVADIPSTPGGRPPTTVSMTEVRAVPDPNTAGEGENLVSGCRGRSDLAAEDGGQPALATTAGIEPQPPTPTPDQELSTDETPSSRSTIPSHDTVTRDANLVAGSLAPEPGAFEFNGTTKFITSSTLDYLGTIPGGQVWAKMVRNYLELEQLPIPKGVRLPSLICDFILTTRAQCPVRIPINSRPGEVGMWIKARSYDARHIPHVPDANMYHTCWLQWWTVCQPAWRKANGWPFLKEGDTGVGWGKLASRGQNGMFVVIMSTTWWAFSIKSPEERHAFEEAVDDVRWVLEELLKLHSTSNTPDPLPPPGPPNAPISTATWLTRSAGKRQSKPSYKLTHGS